MHTGKLEPGTTDAQRERPAVPWPRWTRPRTVAIFLCTMIVYACRVRALPAALALLSALSPLAGCARGPALDPEVAERRLPGPGLGVDDALADAGAWYFRRNCAACHMIGGGEALIGPNLEGVTRRREMAWIAAMIRRPDSMLMADSIAGALFREYQVPMANRQLDDARIRAILEFLWRADHPPDDATDAPSGDAGPEAAPPDSGRSATGIVWSARGRGPALVLIHGTNLDRRLFDGDVAAWADHHRVIRYDLRNHGASAAAGGPWSDVADLAAVLDAAAVDRAVLLGLSAGASVALEAALAHPGRVAGLVLVSPSIRGYRPAPGEVPDVFGPLAQALGEGDPDAAGTALLETPTMAAPARVRPRVAEMVRANLRLFAVDPSWAAPPDPLPLRALPRVRAPTLILAGGDDMPAVLSQARLLAAGIEGAELRVVERGGHLLNLTHPETVQRLVRDWLAAR